MKPIARIVHIVHAGIVESLAIALLIFIVPPLMQRGQNDVGTVSPELPTTSIPADLLAPQVPEEPVPNDSNTLAVIHRIPYSFREVSVR